MQLHRRLDELPDALLAKMREDEEPISSET